MLQSFQPIFNGLRLIALQIQSHTISPPVCFVPIDSTPPLDARLGYPLRVSGVQKRGVWNFCGPRLEEVLVGTANSTAGSARRTTENHRPALTAFAKFSRQGCF